MKCDAVFEGGGVKGIAFVGAIQETEKRGYRYHRLAGTSAGAMTAALLASGYSGKEIEQLMEELSFLRLLDLDWTGRIPGFGRSINILLKKGIYSTSYLEEWMDKQLSRKMIYTFGDLPDEKLKIVASDITNARLMVFPDDLHRYGLNADSFPISRAVQMSIAIPYFFQPVTLRNKNKKSIIVDGGILSNYPIWLFDSKKRPQWPTFGYRLRGASGEQPTPIKGPLTMFWAIFSTMREAHDQRHIEEKDAVRTIFIPVTNVKATDFSITIEQKRELMKLGQEEASLFFNQWNFSTYVTKFRDSLAITVTSKK